MILSVPETEIYMVLTKILPPFFDLEFQFLKGRIIIGVSTNILRDD